MTEEENIGESERRRERASLRLGLMGKTKRV
jgi:hypothetical protein